MRDYMRGKVRGRSLGFEPELILSVAQSMNATMAWDSTERRLIQAAQDGGRAAFDDLVGVHVEDIRAFVGARVDGSDVDDVVQDTLVAAWKAIQMFDGRSRFRTWIFGICQHKIKDHYRSKARKRPDISLDAGLVDPIVEGLQSKTDTAHAVRAAMSRLPETQFEVIELYYRQRLTLAEIAAILERNLNTVKYQFSQGHVRLAVSLEEEGLIQ